MQFYHSLKYLQRSIVLVQSEISTEIVHAMQQFTYFKRKTLPNVNNSFNVAIFNHNYCFYVLQASNRTPGRFSFPSIKPNNGQLLNCCKIRCKLLLPQFTVLKTNKSNQWLGFGSNVTAVFTFPILHLLENQLA